MWLWGRRGNKSCWNWEFHRLKNGCFVLTVEEIEPRENVEQGIIGERYGIAEGCSRQDRVSDRETGEKSEARHVLVEEQLDPSTTAQ